MTDPVCTFTSAVACLSCHQALLASWRAEEPLARDVEKLFTRFRGIHISHPGFRECPPGIGIHNEEDVMPQGRTVVNEVTCDVNPDLEGHIIFSSTNKPLYFTA